MTVTATELSIQAATDTEANAPANAQANTAANTAVHAATNTAASAAAHTHAAVRVPIEPFKTDDEYFRDAMQILAPPSPENCQSCRQPNCDFCAYEPLAKVIGLLKTRDRLLGRLFRMEVSRATLPTSHTLDT